MFNFGKQITMHTFTIHAARGKGFFFLNEGSRRKSLGGEFLDEGGDDLENVLAVISYKVNLYGHINGLLDSARTAVVSVSEYYPTLESGTRLSYFGYLDWRKNSIGVFLNAKAAGRTGTISEMEKVFQWKESIKY